MRLSQRGTNQQLGDQNEHGELLLNRRRVKKTRPENLRPGQAQIDPVGNKKKASSIGKCASNY